MTLLAAATMAVFSFRVRPASEVVQLSTDGVRVDVDAGGTDLMAERRKNDQLGAGRLPHLLVAEMWCVASYGFGLAMAPFLGKDAS